MLLGWSKKSRSEIVLNVAQESRTRSSAKKKKECVANISFYLFYLYLNFGISHKTMVSCLNRVGVRF